jgi:hypothetical protein
VQTWSRERRPSKYTPWLPAASGSATAGCRPLLRKGRTPADWCGAPAGPGLDGVGRGAFSGGARILRFAIRSRAWPAVARRRALRYLKQKMSRMTRSGRNRTMTPRLESMASYIAALLRIRDELHGLGRTRTPPNWKRPWQRSRQNCSPLSGSDKRPLIGTCAKLETNRLG